MRDFNRGRRLPPEPLSDAELLALLGACSRRSSTGIRNAALIVLLWRAGLRCGEALALKPSDVDLEAGTVRVLHGKGDRARTVALGPEALAVVQRWIDRRTALGINGHARLLSTLAGDPVKPSYVRMLLPRLARKAGLTKRVHPHGLRHSFADGLRREGIDVGVISRALGHSSLATTVRYLDHVSPAAVVAALGARAEPAGLAS